MAAAPNHASEHMNRRPAAYDLDRRIGCKIAASTAAKLRDHVSVTSIADYKPGRVSGPDGARVVDGYPMLIFVGLFAYQHRGVRG